MKAWLDILEETILNGEDVPDRTGVGTRRIFGAKLTVRNNEFSFPAVTTKKLAFETVKHELAYFLDPRRPIPPIWEANLKHGGYIPYGKMMRDFNGIDQLKALRDSIRKDPFGRRHLVSMWDPSELDKQCLPPCPFAFQLSYNQGKLDMVVYQRSADLFIGLPFDIAGYALLQRLICQPLGYDSGNLTFLIGDAHIYKNHFKQVAIVLERTPLKEPKLLLAPEANVWHFDPIMAKLQDYEHHGKLEGVMNV